ncbi:hypothetical protein R1sor_025090 [Riccia sorocarpa]|uniref:Uncharacterized protein n=1 Tax=Riccia sorocarpa TaxID=122646 RepID=A0ABD3GAC7_9MARC
MHTSQVYLVRMLRLRAVIHDSYAQCRGKRKDRDEEVTPALAAIRADLIIHLMEKSERKEAWKCDVCNVKGSGYMSCKNHIESERHQKEIPTFPKPALEHNNTLPTENVKPAAPNEKLKKTASSSAQATPPTLPSEGRPHSTTRKLEWGNDKERE